ncbi:DUF3124 domain-containing protein [Polaribacter sp. R77954]|uniref:DUF3124 domain-containing protein n=1 Tax=Polaribacter sp. R77954 TaxID=3093870 RepID=UPI0037C981CA
MKLNYLTILLALLLYNCSHKKEKDAINFENWSKRKVHAPLKDSLEYGKSYLSIYSEIYSFTESKKISLTSMISLRNTSDLDTIYLLKAEYFDTEGESIRKYFDFPIFLKPLETAEIIIDEVDVTGGTGSNFIFEWKTPKHCPEPIFEAVMSSTMSQQGLSFITQSKRIK